MEGVSWSSLNEHLMNNLQSRGKVGISTMVFEMDTQLLADTAGTAMFWADASAELQISFVSPEVAPPSAGVMYSTNIDAWLPVTLDSQRVPRQNHLISSANHSRLQQMLAILQQHAARDIQVGQSAFYGDALQRTGFVTNAMNTPLGLAQ